MYKLLKLTTSQNSDVVFNPQNPVNPDSKPVTGKDASYSLPTPDPLGVTRL
jgi:hypothetical protein